MRSSRPISWGAQVHFVGRGNSVPDRILSVTVLMTVIIVSGVFLWILSDLIRHGVPGLSIAFLVDSIENAGRSGGIGPIFLSTLLILFVCLMASVPLGLMTAIYLAEYTSSDGRFGHLVRRSLDVLAGVPSIVFGLFGNAFFCVYLGMGFSILSGGLTLACMVLPIFIRTAEEGIRSVPRSYRNAAVALGMSRTSTLIHILLPPALPGLAAGLVLGIGRALAETAALIFTSGYVARTPGSLFDSGRALSVHIYDLSMNVAGGDQNAYASALVLVGLLFIINSLATWCLRSGSWLNFRKVGI